MSPARGFMKGYPYLDAPRPPPQGDRPHLDMLPPVPKAPSYQDSNTDGLEDKLGGLALNPKAKEFIPPKNGRGSEVLP